MDEPEHEPREGPSLDADGTLRGRPARTEQAPEPEAVPPPEAPLELQERPRTVRPMPLDHFREPVEPPAPRRGRRAVLVAVGLAALLAGGVGLALFAPPPEGTVRPSSEVEAFLARTRYPVLVDSEPPGATVKIAGEVVGTTPWAGDNRWGDGEVALELPGHAPWKGRLLPRAASTFSVRLKRSPAPR